MFDSYGDVVAHLNETVMKAFWPTHSGFSLSDYDGRDGLPSDIYS